MLSTMAGNTSSFCIVASGDRVDGDPMVSSVPPGSGRSTHASREHHDFNRSQADLLSSCLDFGHGATSSEALLLALVAEV